MGTQEATVEATLRRRRTIEACAITARGAGLLATVLFVTGLLPGWETQPPPSMFVGCLVAIAVMTAANVLAVIAFRHPARRSYNTLSAWQVLLDTAAVTATAVLGELSGSGTVSPALAVPIVVSALRHQLRGALAVWLLTSVAYGSVAVVPGADRTQPGDLLLLIGMNLLIALITGAQSSAYARQLTTLEQTRIELEHRASHDGLTGLPNRARLAEHAERYGDTALAVLVLDLNGFKKINDAWGHAAGDELLRRVAERLTAHLHPPDLAGRLGGDEFLVLLPGTDTGDVDGVVDRLRETIVAPITLDCATVEVGVSVGAAVRPPGARTSLAALTAAADAAMYQEKRLRKASGPRPEDRYPATVPAAAVPAR
ncbi:GGDEF domain-containing protein [Actinoplanes sp. NPDC049118]|uniref:GGDEF domain-containing protein n=1 Tax=Actinoplanes sp. NPDC049118 TaxID=3155769 RepID=UPI0033DBDAC2